MVEKGKVEMFNITNALDEIGCNCNSCNDTEEKSEAKVEMFNVANVLDDIGCNCTSCGDDGHNHDHDHTHEVDDVFDHPVEKIKVLQLIKGNLKLVVSFVLFFTALFTHFPEVINLSLYISAYILVSYKVLYKAVKNVLKGEMLDENFLMAIASIVAFLIGEYAEGVAVMLFYAVGQLTEDYALTRSKSNISKLLDLKPDYANIKTEQGLKTVDPMAIKVGDIIVVKPGEKIPLDGVVVKGSTSVDASMLTGESLPVTVEVEQEVYSGTINIEGVIEIKVSKSFEHSTVAKILTMVQKAGENKAHTEKFITKFAKIYTPLVVVGAVLISVVPPLLFGQSFSTWVYRGAIFLVVSCPCALVISVPLGYFGGIGGAARKGILVKGGQFLEALKVAKVIVFDKTGTLTKGNFKLDHIETVNLSEQDALKISAHIESFSNHPIAKAIVKSYDGILDQNRVHDVQEIAGRGLVGIYEGKRVLVGNDALMMDRGIGLTDAEYHGTRIYLAVDETLEAVFFINDQLKDQTKEGLAELRRLGIEKFVMLTGDRAPIADHIARELDIDEVHSELMPGDKLEILEGLLSEDHKVVFVGDGINDAPVLTRADVGIAMGRLGSDVAIESSDVVLMTDEITKVAEGIKVSRFTSHIIMQNIILALGIKIIIMILGTLGYANLWTAVFGDVGVAFIAILNSGRAIYNK